jgi:hypothetical protein
VTHQQHASYKTSFLEPVSITILVQTTSKNLTTEIAGIRKELGNQLESLRKDVITGLDAVHNDINDFSKEVSALKISVAAFKVWTLKLQLSIAIVLLGVMAHGFKWI